jgi:hypothetical protein
MSESLILQVLERAGILLASPLIRDGAGKAKFFAVVDVTRDQGNRQIPSNRKLLEAKAHLAEVAITLDFLLRDAETHDIEAGLRATLLHAYIDDIRNVFLSVDSGETHVWIEPKSNLGDELIARITSRANQFLQDVGLSVASLKSTTNQRLPTKLALLATVRLLAPVSLRELSDSLTKGEFEVPSIEWLNRRLDALRKEGAVVRTDGGLYALTLRSLSSLGTTKNSKSPDISRLLNLSALDK